MSGVDLADAACGVTRVIEPAVRALDSRPGRGRHRTCAARQARAAMLELMLPEYCPGGVEHAGLPRSGQVPPERPRGATREVTPWCHVPGQKPVVRSGVAQVLSVIVMLIQSVSSARRKSPCVIGLGPVALGTRVGAAVTLGTGGMNVTGRVTVDGTSGRHSEGEGRSWKARRPLVLLCHVMRRTDVFQIRVEPELRDRLARLRDERHVNVSAWARDVIAAALDREFPADLEAPKRHPLAGWRPCKLDDGRGAVLDGPDVAALAEDRPLNFLGHHCVGGVPRRSNPGGQPADAKARRARPSLGKPGKPSSLTSHLPS